MDGSSQLEDVLGRGGAGVVYELVEGCRTLGEVAPSRALADRVRVVRLPARQQRLALSPDGTLLVSTTVGVVVVQALPSGKVLRKLENPGRLCIGWPSATKRSLVPGSRFRT